MSEAIVKPTKSDWAQQFVQQARAELARAPSASVGSYVRETGSTAVEYLQAGATGSLLGAAHGKWGLDSAGVPADGILAGLGALVSVALSGHLPGVAAHARRVGAQAFTVLAFRRSYELVRHEPLPGGRDSPGVQRLTLPGAGAGVTKVDRIEAVARELNI